MNRWPAITLTFHSLTHPKFTTPLISRLGSIPRVRMAVGALALGFGVFAGAFNSQATSNYWITASDDWSDPAAWSAGAPPAISDDAYFTNAAVYTIHMTADQGVTSNTFANGSGTVAIVTMDMGTSKFQPSGTFVVGAEANASNTVYIASNTNATGAGFANAGPVTVGRNGDGTLIVTNGQVGPNPPTGFGLSLGNGNGGRVHLVISGPNTLVLCSVFQAGANSNCEGSCTVVITNGATLQTSSSIRIGSGSGSASTNNSVVIFSGGRFYVGAGPIVIGARSSTPLPGTFPCVDNSVLVKSGGLFAGIGGRRTMDIGDANFVGQASTGPYTCSNNSLTVEFGGSVTSVSTISVTPTNALNLFGGYLDVGVITNFGTMTAWGTIRAGIIVTNGGTLRARSSQGRLVLTNGLVLANSATLEMELGSSFPAGPPGAIDCASIVYSNVASVEITSTANGETRLFGTLNFTDSGGFAPGTYTILTYVPSPTSGTPTNFTWAGTIGTVPNNTFTYAIDTNTIGKMNLIVTGPVTIPFRIISVAKSVNDVVLTWTAPASVINRVQATLGTLPSGSFNTNGFADITGDITTAASGTNTFTDTGGATNKPARYYRVRQP